ncbi:MAG: hypothetical protein ACREF4_06005 [Gammaproteobacteria bacterium]
MTRGAISGLASALSVRASASKAVSAGEGRVGFGVAVSGFAGARAGGDIRIGFFSFFAFAIFAFARRAVGRFTERCGRFARDIVGRRYQTDVHGPHVGAAVLAVALHF